MSVAHVRTSSAKQDVSAQGGLGNLNLTRPLLRVEALLQMSSYVGTGLSYVRVRPRGSLHRQETIKAQTQVQAVLLGGWLSSRLSVANWTEQS